MIDDLSSLPSDRSPSSQAAFAPRGYFLLSQKAVAVVSVSLAVSALTALFITASVGNADALTSIALALAIVSFVVQILFFVGQTLFTLSQTARSESVFAETQVALQSLKSSTERTSSAVEGQLERLLTAVLEKRLPERVAGGEPARPEDFARSVARNVSSAIEHSDSPSGLDFPRRTPEPIDAELVELLSTFPTPDEVAALLPDLASLRPMSLYWLRSLGDDEVRSRRPGSSFEPGLYLSGTTADDLTSRGWIRPFQPLTTNPDGTPYMHLTPTGREAARILTAKNDPPAAHTAEIRDLRDRADAIEESLNTLSADDDA